jgi:hypothetical protein
MPAVAPSGRYLVTVRNTNSLWSNPAFLTVRDARPTTEYILAHLQHIDIPTDHDDINFFESGTEEGEFRFDFATGTGDKDNTPILQKISLGAHPTNGFEVRDRLRLDPKELQLPIFAAPRSKMEDQLLFTFFGREVDGSDGAWVGWQYLGEVAGAGLGGYFGGLDTAVSGYKLGSELGKKLGKALADSGEQSLGVHTQVYSREDDFGMNRAGYPNVLSFDNNEPETPGRDINIMYRVRSVDAPRVRRVRVTLDSIDTRKIQRDTAYWSTSGPVLDPLNEIYVFARAFDAPYGGEYPVNRRYSLQPSDSPSRAAVLARNDRVLFNTTVDHDLPFLYIEVSLWARGVNHDRMIARPYSNLWLPEHLLKASENAVTLSRTARVAPSPGHGSKGEYTFYYTIAIQR